MEPSASLNGTVFCLTGTFSVSRAAIEDRIKQLGGSVAKTVTKKVEALVVADPSNITSKLQAAVDRGVHVLDEAFVDACEKLAALQAAPKKGKKAVSASKTTEAGESKPAAKRSTRKKKEPEPEPEPEPEAEAKPQKAKKVAGKGKAKKAMPVDDEFDDEDAGPAASTSAPAASSSSMGPAFFGRAPKVPTWKNNAPGQPYFPQDYNIVMNAVLQNTEIGSNKNKYYALELHEAQGQYWRLFTHYGRTDDLQSRGASAGQRESRYYGSLADAQAAYGEIYRQKTSARKGYREISLAASSIGSDKARGKSAGDIGASTLARTKRPADEEQKQAPETAATTKKGRANKRSKKGEEKEQTDAGAESKQQEDNISLDVQVRELVRYIYEEAKVKLTSSINAEITADGIRTPLGILAIEQVEMGEHILDQIQQEVMRSKPRDAQLEALSGEFYSTIPHRLGRTKAEVKAAVIRNEAMVKEKRELLQLMKDMLEVNSNAKENVIFNDDTVSRYRALQSEISWLAPSTEEYALVAARVEESVKLSHNRPVKLCNVFKVCRPEEQARFRHDIGNVEWLFHGSRLSNWVGLLSRGILMPKVVVAEGGRRTDAGWLGNGIYFGHVDVARQYAAPGRKNTSLIYCNSVAIGRTKDFSAITYGMNSAPKGYHSCHGVMGTQFADHEYCVYDDAQQKVEYLLEVQQGKGFMY